MIKQGLTLMLPVNFKNLDFSRVKQIEFIFKQDKNSYDDSVKKALYSTEYESECVLRPGTTIIDVPWSVEDTYLFKSCNSIFMDTRITYNDSQQNPITNIVSFPLKMSLFEEEVNDENEGE